jgi:hypothetical protein
MRIREVDLPDELIEAHRAGNLVIFVGAGASRAAPSSLPDFRTLTQRIAAEARQSVTDNDLDAADVFLGRLSDGPFDVHRRVAAHIGFEGSGPNRLHEALVRLAAASSPIRIVTTNYDLHLSSVLAANGLVVDEYVGPALPVGSDFTGIVYLHGNLRQEPRSAHLASVSLFSDADTLDWLPEFATNAALEDRVEWCRQIRYILDELATDVIEQQWQRWMERYWQARLDSVPVLMTTDEQSAMATWVAYLTDSIPAGVHLATAQPAGLEEHADLLRKLNDATLDRAPREFATLVAHLLRGTNPPFWDCRDLERVFQHVHAVADPAKVTTIVQQAVRLGCTGLAATLCRAGEVTNGIGGSASRNAARHGCDGQCRRGTRLAPIRGRHRATATDHPAEACQEIREAAASIETHQDRYLTTFNP